MKTFLRFFALVLCPSLVFATPSGSHADPISGIVFWVTLIFLFGIIGRYLAKRLNQPGVLGELLMGVLVGNVCYFLGVPLMIVLREGAAIFDIISDLLSGTPLLQSVQDVIPSAHYSSQVLSALSGPNATELVRVAYIVDGFSRYGVIFLLFLVGLESSVEELKHTGRESIQVAIIGVAAPMLLSLLVTHFLMPEATFKADLFVAATLTATSIGITARVLKDIKKIRTREAKTILGAAMIDDVLGLIILAVVSSIVIHGVISLFMMTKLIVLAIVFFLGSLWIGPFLLKKITKFLHVFELWETKLIVSFIFLMSLCWLASVVQLAAIIGAFVAGLIIHDGYFEATDGQFKKTSDIHSLVAPLEGVLAPLFFMLIGIQVKIETFFNWHVVLVALGLIVAATVGKLLSGLGGSSKDDKLLIGIGMLPRGEVGLVFASIGRSIGVITDELFTAIILMIIVTTFVAPPWLKQRYVSTGKLTSSE